MLTDGLEWCGLLVDAHSDGTHSLQSIHCWDTDAMLHFSKSDEKQTHLHFGWPESFFFLVYFFSNIHFGVNYPLRSSGDTCRRGKSTHLLSHWDVRGCNQCQLIFQPVVVSEIIKSLNCSTPLHIYRQACTNTHAQASSSTWSSCSGKSVWKSVCVRDGKR